MMFWIKFGLIAAGVAALGVLGWRIHHAGYESGLARDAAKLTQADARVRSLQATNDANLAVVAQLRTANARYAQAAQMSVAQATAAAAAMQATRHAAARNAARTQHDLMETIHAHPAARAWAAARVPDAVADQLRQHAAAH